MDQWNHLGFAKFVSDTQIMAKIVQCLTHRLHNTRTEQYTLIKTHGHVTLNLQLEECVEQIT